MNPIRERAKHMLKRVKGEIRIRQQESEIKEKMLTRLTAINLIPLTPMISNLRLKKLITSLRNIKAILIMCRA
jgi:hypothetical protein